MKNIFKARIAPARFVPIIGAVRSIAIIAIVVMIVFSMTACPESGPGPGPGSGSGLSIVGIWQDTSGNDVLEFTSAGKFRSFVAGAGSDLDYTFELRDGFPVIVLENDEWEVNQVIEFYSTDEGPQPVFGIITNKIRFLGSFDTKLTPYYPSTTSNYFELTRKGTDGSFVRPFVAVTNIIDVPTEAYRGLPLALTGKVEPYEAWFSDIIWSGEGVTGSSLAVPGDAAVGSKLSATATIKDGKAMGDDFVKTFEFTVVPPPPPADTIFIEAPGTSATALTGTLTGSGGDVSPDMYSFEVEKGKTYRVYVTHTGANEANFAGVYHNVTDSWDRVAFYAETSETSATYSYRQFTAGYDDYVVVTVRKDSIWATADIPYRIWYTIQN